MTISKGIFPANRWASSSNLSFLVKQRIKENGRACATNICQHGFLESEIMKNERQLNYHINSSRGAHTSSKAIIYHKTKLFHFYKFAFHAFDRWWTNCQSNRVFHSIQTSFFPTRNFDFMPMCEFVMHNLFIRSYHFKLSERNFSITSFLSTRPSFPLVKYDSIRIVAHICSFECAELILSKC